VWRDDVDGRKGPSEGPKSKKVGWQVEDGCVQI